MKYFILSILIAFAFVSCDRSLGTTQDDLSDVEMIFRADFNGEPFVANQAYDYGDAQVRFQTFSFFISDVRVGTTASSAEVEDIEYFEFGSINTEAESLEGISFAQSSVPARNYEGLALGLGVVADYNAESPSDFGPFHPLSDSGRYWSDWGSYIFLRIEGTMDTDGDGQFDDVSFVYHVGGNDAYQNVEIQENIDVIADSQMQVTATVDLFDIFSNDQVTHDIESQPRLHDANDPLINFMMGNFRNAITIE